MSSNALNQSAGGIASRSGMPGSPARKHGIGRANITVLAVFLIPAGLLFLPTTLLLVLGLVPTLVALIVDRDPERYAAIAVAPVNFCGVLPLIMTLWQRGHDMREAVNLLSDPLNWLIMFGAAAVGWAIFFAVPPVVASFLAQRNETEIKRLTEHQEKLVEEWGPEVTQGAAHPSVKR